jgi:hypothetical protein
MRRIRHRQQLALLTLGVVALAAIVWIAAGALGRPRSDGPLSSSTGYVLHAKLAPGETMSWSVGLPFNHSDRDAVIRAVDLVGVRDIDVLAIVATYGVERPDGSCLAAGGNYGYPPTAAEPDGTTYEFPTHQIVGVIVPSERNRTCTKHPVISVGVRRRGGPDPSGIEAIRVRYEHAGIAYEVVLPWSLSVEPKP